MGIKWWHIVGLIAVYICCGKDLAIMLTLIYGIYLIKNYFKSKEKFTDTQTRADIQDLDNDMEDLEAILEQMDTVRSINDEMDEIEAVLDQLSETRQTNRKIIPIWELNKEP